MSAGNAYNVPIKEDTLRELSRRLDDFYRKKSISKQALPSSLLSGALYTCSPEVRANNIDWIAQTAHSLREIFYNLGLGETIGTYPSRNGVQKIGEYYNLMSEIAHHNFSGAGESRLVGGTKQKPVEITDEIFLSLVHDFANAMFSALRRQLDAHIEIDQILKQGPTVEVKEHLQDLLQMNIDAKEYFYANAGSQWIDWLWDEGYLSAVTRKAKDQTRFSHSMPELLLLSRVSNESPTSVSRIIKSVAINDDNFNPEVVDRFLRTCGELPAEYLANNQNGITLVQKIHDEEWPRLMSGFNRWGFDYQQMLKKLAIAEQYDVLLMLASAVLQTRPAEDVVKSGSLIDRSWFYFNDFSHMELFETLADVPVGHSENVIELLSKTLQEVISGTLRESDTADALPYHDDIWLSDVDLFTIQIESDSGYDSMQDIKNLIACLRIHSSRLMSGQTKDQVIDLFEKHFAPMPQTETVWRLQFSVLAARPDVFIDMLLERLNSLFTAIEEEKRYTQLSTGTEYQRALQTVFPLLTVDQQHRFIENIISHFKTLVREHEDESWHVREGSEMLSCIAQYVQSVPDLLQEAEEAGFTVRADYQPEPGVMHGIGGTVQSRGILTQEQFGVLSLDEIIEHLSTDWAPIELRKQNKDEDFLKPTNADGVGKQLQADMPKRLQEYISRAPDFFEPVSLDLHYTYSFLEGIDNALKNHSEAASVVDDWSSLFVMMQTLIQDKESYSQEGRKEERGFFETWLFGWPAIATSLVNVARGMLSKQDGQHIFPVTKYEKEILALLQYGLEHPDPDMQKEDIETAKMTTKHGGDQVALVSDPFSMAINTVRGRAFEGFVIFVEVFDGMTLSGRSQKILSSVILNEHTRALYFMLGRHFPFFYSRSRTWGMDELFPLVFEDTTKPEYLSDAAWEGYLSGNLYHDLFFTEQMQQLYLDKMTIVTEPTRHYFRNPNEGVAAHLALAIVVYHKDLGLDYELFETFWKDSTEEQQREFVKEVGRIFIASDNERNRKLHTTDPEVAKRLAELWKWLLNHDLQPNVYSEFGFWIKDELSLFDLSWLTKMTAQTILKSDGVLEWEYGLTKMIESLVKADPDEGFVIVRTFLLQGAIGRGRYFAPVRYEREWYRAVEYLYNNTLTRDLTVELIDELLEKGGSDYWDLKKIITSADQA